MALVYRVQMQAQVTAYDVAKCPIVVDALPVEGVIQGPGIVPMGSPGGTWNFYCRHGNYLKIGNINSLELRSCGGNRLPVNCTLESWTTEPGVMDGVTVSGATVTVRVRARYTVLMGFPVPLSRQIWISYYHVAVGGAETLLGSSNRFGIGAAWATKTGGLTFSGSFGAGERFRAKHRGFLGGV